MGATFFDSHCMSEVKAKPRRRLDN